MLILKLLPLTYNRVIKRGIFKTNIHPVSVESFLCYLSSSFYRQIKTAFCSVTNAGLTDFSRIFLVTPMSPIPGVVL